MSFFPFFWAFYFLKRLLRENTYINLKKNFIADPSETVPSAPAQILTAGESQWWGIMATMSESVTLLLRQWQAGNNEAVEQLMPLVYDQLRVLAKRYMRNERQEHTLRPTAVVHEAYLRLTEADSPFTDRVHFFAVAATVMRHILIDWAKSHRRAKRGGGVVNVQLEENSAISQEEPETILEVDRLLERLSAFDERKAKITEMIFFGGMTYEETAAFLGISDVTVHRELKMAKAWMLNELTPHPASSVAK